LRELLALRGQEDSLAEEVEVGAAEHLAFDHLDAVEGMLQQMSDRSAGTVGLQAMSDRPDPPDQRQCRR
jgi:hypothetical protein